MDISTPVRSCDCVQIVLCNNQMGYCIIASLLIVVYSFPIVLLLYMALFPVLPFVYIGLHGEYYEYISML